MARMRSSTVRLAAFWFDIGLSSGAGQWRVGGGSFGQTTNVNRFAARVTPV